MPFALEDLLDSVEFARGQLKKHLGGVRDDQWDWKPYPECKSIRETLVHLVQDDIAALRSLKLGQEPDYAAIDTEARERIAGKDLEGLRAVVDETRQDLMSFVRERFGDAPLDTQVSFWGMPMKLGRAMAYLTSEDYYHAGQIAFIGMATDPEWNYYATVYGV